MSGLWREIADLVLPVDCAGCGRNRGGALCDACRTRLGGTGTVRRVWPDPVPPELPAVYAAGAYEDELRAVLLAHKERGVLRLAHPLGDALAAAVAAALATGGREGWGEGEGDPHTRAHAARDVSAHHTAADHPSARHAASHPASTLTSAGAPAHRRRHPWPVHAASLPAGAPLAGAPVLLVPVPSARHATAARGHDPARRIALRAARELRRAGTAARMLPVLRQRRPVADQAALSAADRLTNLAGALRAVPGSGRLLSSGPVIVVDDLMTTGASLTEAARAVEVAGGRVHGAGVIAASPRSYGLPGSGAQSPER